MKLESYIRTIPDFPKKNILFYDLSTLIVDPKAWREAIRQMAAIVKPWSPDLLLGVESRGFLVAAPLSLELDIGFAMVRKKGKLPGSCAHYSYDLEYGHDTIEIQKDILKPGMRVVILDDLLATGGTMAAGVTLAQQMGADVIGATCIVELTGLGGRERLDIPFKSLLKFDV